MTQTLTLMRHAHADWPPGEHTGGDDQRPLSPRGVLAIERMLPKLLAMGLAPGLIFHSPLTRTAQTAELIAAGLGCSQCLRPTASLRPGYFDEQALATLFLQIEECNWVMIVGHNPDITQVQHTLTRQYHAFSPGTVVTMDITRLRPTVRASVRWHLTPDG